MNAIILAAGKSSRMYESGENLPKGLMPILGIPNIERTILMLHMLDIYEIIIAVPAETQDFDYLYKKYSCTIIHIPSTNKNTLTTMNYLISYIDDSFIIEGDVVCVKNIFRSFEYSTYYVMKYAYPESDEWNVITSSYDNIIGFEIGTHRSPAIFGISFWRHEDCPLLKKYIKTQMQSNNAVDCNFFWDNHIDELLKDICIKAYEISSDVACEMNTFTEYQYAVGLCKKMISVPKNFFENVLLRKNNAIYYIQHSGNKVNNLQWLKKLFSHYHETLDADTVSRYYDWYNPKELVFVIKNNENREIAFFSFIIEKNFILLRRLFIDSSYRAVGIGKEIVKYIQLFAISSKKELRANIYDEKVAGFYEHLGATKIFSTYHWNLPAESKESDNE